MRSTYNGQKTAIRPFPISVDFEELSQDAQKEEVAAEIERLKDQTGFTVMK